MRLLAKDKDGDKEPSALACYGLLRKDSGDMMLRFVEGRPVSAVTIAFLEWATTTLAAQGMRVMVWDNASCPKSLAIRTWIKDHNRHQKTAPEPGCRLVCPLPVKIPWLNNIEPKWVHGKKNTLDKHRTLSAKETKSQFEKSEKQGAVKWDSLVETTISPLEISTLELQTAR